MQSSSSEMEVYVGELQKKFDRLKVLYEQFFMGIEKVEPLTARKEMSRAIIALQQLHLRSTGLRFKIATLIQKWNIYQSYWNRTMRDIEAGRYTRHVATARRHAEQAGLVFPAREMGLNLPVAHTEEPAPPAPPPPSDLPATTVRDVPQMAAPKEPPAPRSQPSSLPEIPGMSEAQLRALHERVVSAQRSVGETAEVRFEVLVAQLSRQVPKLLEEHGCTGVTFDVITRDGKVKLKPSPQK